MEESQPGDVTDPTFSTRGMRLLLRKVSSSFSPSVRCIHRERASAPLFYPRPHTLHRCDESTALVLGSRNKQIITEDFLGPPAKMSRIPDDVNKLTESTYKVQTHFICSAYDIEVPRERGAVDSLVRLSLFVIDCRV